jgi:hypothetical protein
MSSKRTRIASALLLSFGALAPAVILAEPPALPAPPPCGVRLSIAIKTPPMPEDPWVEVTGTLKNEGSKAVVLVEPGDGSESGWRTPVLSWRARRIEPGRVTEVPVEPGARCGLMNGPDPEKEVFKLAPGASRRLSGWALVAPPLAPGLYEVELTYTNDPRIGFRGAIPDDPARSPYGKSMACTAVSNPLRIEVPAPAATDKAAEEPGTP